MANSETNIKLSMDTRPAEQDLKKLEGKATQSGKRASKSLGKTVGAGMNFVGLGPARPSAVVGQVRGAISGGVGDVMSAYMQPILMGMMNKLFKGEDLKAVALSTEIGRLSPGILRAIGRDDTGEWLARISGHVKQRAARTEEMLKGQRKASAILNPGGYAKAELIVGSIMSWGEYAAGTLKSLSGLWGGGKKQ